MLVKCRVIERISSQLGAILADSWRRGAYDAVIDVNELTRNVLRRMIKYHRDPSQIVLNDTNVYEYLKASIIVGFTAIEELCKRYYENTVTIENCIERWALRGRYSTTDLKSAALIMFAQNFHQCMRLESFFALKADAVCRLLRKDFVEPYSEELIFEAIIQWIHYDVDNRFKHFPKLMETVRIDFVKLSVRFNSIS